MEITTQHIINVLSLLRISPAYYCQNLRDKTFLKLKFKNIF